MLRPALTVALLLATVAAGRSEKTLLNLDRHGVAIHGYDPVAYFTDNKAVKGDAKFESSYKGAKYHFASDEHKKLFDATPEKYAPQFGGYCGWAVSNNDTADIDPEAFTIMDGRLILQYSKSILNKWNKDPQGRLAKADVNWPKLVESEGK